MSKFNPIDKKVYENRLIKQPLGFSRKYGYLTYQRAAHELAFGILDELRRAEQNENVNREEFDLLIRKSNANASVLNGKVKRISQEDWEIFAVAAEGWIVNAATIF